MLTVWCVCSHRVEGVDYLRADYSVECHTPEFMAMAAYAGVWLVLYVAAFPLFVLCKLWSYREAEEVRRAAEKEKKKREKEEKKSEKAETQSEEKQSEEKHEEEGQEYADLRFLLTDYKATAPVLAWEGVEMIRKLLLSVIGSFWSTK
jgi:flagellar biosynthesis/type III secretory pathway M-ring protein FliF/YscJ